LTIFIKANLFASSKYYAQKAAAGCIRACKNFQVALNNCLPMRLGRGDQTAFSALYDRLSGPLYSLALKMFSDASDAQDALRY
jgi:hypothetical protein